jgi:hypothetical protein
MDYSSDFILRAVQAAQGRVPGRPWADRPIGERVTLIYKEMQRLHWQTSLAPAFDGAQSLWSRARGAWQETDGPSPR